VSDANSAKRLSNRIEFALSDGPKSTVWGELRPSLPAASFKTLTDGLGLAAESPTIREFERKFTSDLSRRNQLGQIAGSTAALYERVGASFFRWLETQGVGKMDEIFNQDVDDYLLHRRGKILARNPEGGARGLETESKILRALFSFAVESGAIHVSPLKELYKSDVPAEEPEPFTSDELRKMDEAAEGETRLAYLILRWTGLRVSDVAALTWGAVDLEKRTLTWLTQKRKKTVCIPLSEELTAELEERHSRVSLKISKLQLSGCKIIPNATRARLYGMIKELGKKAGVENVHPHRCRANFACMILQKGGSIWDVAQMLGDQVSTVEKYYGKFTDQARDRIRNVLSN
jgi:integrase